MKTESARMTEKEMMTKLLSGLDALHLHLNHDQCHQLIEYLNLLSKWNRIYNLTAVRNIEQMLTHHLLDSLAIVQKISHCSRLLDVGAGGGLPGLVVAIACPNISVNLIDIVSKKTAFIRQVAIELQLNNVAVHTGRVEQLVIDPPFDGIISRAFSSLNDFVSLSSHLLSENGRFYAMKGLIPKDEISNLDKSWHIVEIVPLSVPQLHAQRHLIVIEKKTPASSCEVSNIPS